MVGKWQSQRKNDRSQDREKRKHSDDKKRYAAGRFLKEQCFEIERNESSFFSQFGILQFEEK